METIKYFIRQRSKLCVGKRKIRKRARKNYAYAQYVKKKKERKKNAYRQSIKITISNETVQCQETATRQNRKRCISLKRCTQADKNTRIKCIV